LLKEAGCASPCNDGVPLPDRTAAAQARVDALLAGARARVGALLAGAPAIALALALEPADELAAQHAREGFIVRSRMCRIAAQAARVARDYFNFIDDDEDDDYSYVSDDYDDDGDSYSDDGGGGHRYINHIPMRRTRFPHKRIFCLSDVESALEPALALVPAAEEAALRMRDVVELAARHARERFIARYLAAAPNYSILYRRRMIAAEAARVVSRAAEVKARDVSGGFVRSPTSWIGTAASLITREYHRGYDDDDNDDDDSSYGDGRSDGDDDDDGCAGGWTWWAPSGRRFDEW
jgi:hypothetical protein